MLKIYCDGACSGNPGPGSWAYVVFEGDVRIASGCGFSQHTTNNQMELTAAIKALEAFDNVEIVLDSKYVKDGITSWIFNWKKNGWKSATGAVKNVELWKALDDLAAQRKVIWSWQKGHAGSNHDFADDLARESILKFS
jgi:ribonuclease HI